ncbi:YoaK family protein [Robbsia sp. KACC 23696]|uniref:YoaK family protein n=1 Tax=Robbsia sp. KACC 23696 TaxID=3149231 RepID=UPI00325B9F2C
MQTSVAAEPDTALHVSIRRVVMLTMVCGLVEVIGYTDAANIYPAIMTGNTVQLGSTLANAQWSRFGLLCYAIGAFFIGCFIASLIRRHLRRPPLELALMAVLLVGAGFVRTHAALRVMIELPMLALALGMQGETVSRFGAVSLQTLVVTNNMVKFSDAVVGRFLSRRASTEKRPDLAEVLLPGLAWLTYALAAALGALTAHWIAFPLLVPALLLVVITADLLHGPQS